MENAVAPAEIRSLRTKIFYGLGSIAYGVKDNGFQTILLPFYNLVLHVPAHLVGLAIFIALMFDAFVDPIIGHFSDNLNTRWGRRHPLMYASALPVAVSYLLLWNPPHWSPDALFVYLIVVAIVVRTFITFYEIPSSALVPELTSDYDERTSFIGYRVFFAWYGALVMLVLAFLVFMGPSPPPGSCEPAGQLHAEGYARYGMVAAVVMFVAIIVSAAGTHRFIPYFRKPEAAQRSLWQYVREMFQSLSNRAFLILLAALIFFNLANGLVFALNFYVNTFFWKLNNAQIGVLSMSLFIAVAFGFSVALPMSRWLGKKLSAILMFASGYLLSSAPLLLGLMGVLPVQPSPTIVAILFVAAVIGSGLAIGSSVMVVSMIADVVEDSEIETGRRSEGLFFAGNSFMQKAASGLGLFVSGIILAAVGFPTGTMPCAVDPQIVRNFCIVYFATVCVTYTIGFVLIAMFPISRQSHADNLKKLAGAAGEFLVDEPPGPTN
ncbi:MAG TPA: MFS transporter [Rhizomicrobium sp.]|nr:MFS transporter [Rhizomicrobium sp.]